MTTNTAWNKTVDTLNITTVANIASIAPYPANAIGTFWGGNGTYGLAYLTSEAVNYTTGTASQSGYVITGVGTTFTSAMEGGIFIFDESVSDDYGVVLAVLSSTSLLVNISATVSSFSFNLLYGGIQHDRGGFLSTQTINCNNSVQVGELTYAAGTISQSGNTITGSGTTFTNAMQGGLVYIPGSPSPYGVIRNVLSATSLNMSTSQSFGGGTFYILYYGGTQIGGGYVGIANLTAQAATNTDNIGNFRGSTSNCGTFITPSSVVTTSGVSNNQVYATSDTSDSFKKYTITHDSTVGGNGAIVGFGAGNGAQDTFLYRGGANTLVLSTTSGGSANGIFNTGQLNTTIFKPITGSYSIAHQGTAESGYSWTSVEASLYSTGTVAQSGTTVTGSGTTFTQAMQGGIIVYTDGTGNYGFITSVNSTTSLTVSTSATVSAGTTFNLLYAGVQKSREGYFAAQTIYAKSSITGWRPVVSQSSNFTLAFSDAGAFEDCNSASTITVTIPTNATVAFTVGTEIDFFRHGAGAVTFAAAGGVTLLSQASDLNIGLQYQGATLKKIATDTWVLIGALTT